MLRNLRLAIPLLFSRSSAVSFEDSMLAYSPTAFYEASLSPLWQDSARTTAAAANADVTGAWDDLSGNGYHVTEATTANKATLRTNVLNGLSVIRFDGSNDKLVNSSFPDFGDAYTAYCVMAFNSAGDTSQGVWDVGTGSVNTGFMMQHDATGARWQARDASAVVNIGATDLRDDTFRLHTGRNTGSQMQYWRDGTSIGTANYTAPNPNSLTTICIGMLSSNATFALNGDIAMLAIFNTSHDTTTREAIEDLILARYGLGA